MKRNLITLFALLGLGTNAAYAMPDLSEDQMRAASAVESTSHVPSEQQREYPYQYAL
jgi:hypothetical protein